MTYPIFSGLLLHVIYFFFTFVKNMHKTVYKIVVADGVLIQGDLYGTLCQIF